jgi:hypothetical protein
MTRTFLLALNLPDNEDLDSTAADIQDSLEQDGFIVESVKPWASPLSAPSELSPLSLPTLGA